MSNFVTPETVNSSTSTERTIEALLLEIEGLNQQIADQTEVIRDQKAIINFLKTELKG